MGLSSMRKSLKIRRLSKQLAARSEEPASLDEVLGKSPASRKYQQAVAGLLSLVETDPHLRQVIEYHKVDRQELEKCFQHLLAIGCGQWARGHFVAASGLAFVPTLAFVMQAVLPKIRGEADPAAPSDLRVAGRLIEYYERGEVGPVTLG